MQTNGANGYTGNPFPYPPMPLRDHRCGAIRGLVVDSVAPHASLMLPCWRQHCGPMSGGERGERP